MRKILLLVILAVSVLSVHSQETTLTWKETKEGEKRYRTEVQVFELLLLGSGKEVDAKEKVA